ncbi:hypothetical protein [Vibrio sp. D431a]|uniref:hypothetical protein n=1 Tax=Vibrio sp. D431a TaxID=2837388 RepID=UPI002556BB88|nr:hypothetical protein [Vibrio sp. D431a]MDK9793357.1 hypothetical protein [Vibrio sp. D431a]
MFKLDAINRICALQIGYEAGLQINKAESLLAKDELLNMVDSAIGSSTDWSPDATAFAKCYEEIVDEANRKGGEIYDTCVTWFHNNNGVEILSVIRDLARTLKGHKVKFKIAYGHSNEIKNGTVIPVIDEIMCSNWTVDRIHFYTTTKGAEITKRVFNDSFIGSPYFITYHALEMNSESILDLALAHANKGIDILSKQSLVSITDKSCSLYINDEQYKLIGRIFSKREKMDDESIHVVKDTSGAAYLPIHEALERTNIKRMQPNCLL